MKSRAYYRKRKWKNRAKQRIQKGIHPIRIGCISDWHRGRIFYGSGAVLCAGHWHCLQQHHLDSSGTGHVHRRLCTDSGKSRRCDWVKKDPASWNCRLYIGKCAVSTGKFPRVYDDSPIRCGHWYCRYDPGDHGLYRHEFSTQPSSKGVFSVYADFQRVGYFRADSGRLDHLRLWLACHAVDMRGYLRSHFHRLRIDCR